MIFFKNFKKHKIIFPIITFIFSFFLFNNNVFAFGELIGNAIDYSNTDKTGELIINNLNYRLTSGSYSPSFETWYNENILPENTNVKNTYGKYYFCYYSSQYYSYCYLSNSENMLYMRLTDDYFYLTASYKYTENNPITKLDVRYSTVNATTQNYTSNLSSNIFNVGSKIYTNINNIPLKEIYKNNTYYNTLIFNYGGNNYYYNIDDYIFYRDNITDNYILNITGYDGVKIPTINSLEFKEDIIKKNSYVASNYELTIDNYSEDYNYYFAYASCMENNSCYNLTYLNSNNKYNNNLGKYNYQEDYFLNINGLIDENGKINISLFTNDTIIVLINDKNGNFVESKTFTITEIDEKKTNINKIPYFTVENYTSDSCKIYENETEYKLCTSFKIYINDMANVHNYKLYQSLNSADDFKEIGIWNDSASITLYKNGDYAIYKLTDLEGNIIDTITVNAGGLKIFDENDTEVYLKYETNYNEDTKNAVVKYYFYNYKFDNYKIYYSIDGMCSEFNEITLNYENDIVGSYQDTYKENKTICFKITDLEDNYIKSFTYNLDYFSIIKNDEDYTTFDYMFDYIKELANDANKIFIHMTNVYNKIMTTNLGTYVMLIIFTCIIILILKALSR